MKQFLLSLLALFAIVLPSRVEGGSIESAIFSEDGFISGTSFGTNLTETACAELENTSFQVNSPDCETPNANVFYWANEEPDSAIYKRTCSLGDYTLNDATLEETDLAIELDTSTPLRRYILPGQSPTNLVNNIYLDTMVQFTESEVVPEVLPTEGSVTGDKIMVWLYGSYDENAVNPDGGRGATTNLYVTAGVLDEDMTAITPQSFKITNLTIAPNEWHRLQIKARPVTATNPIPQFEIYVDGTQAESNGTTVFGSLISYEANQGMALSDVAFRGTGAIDYVAFSGDAVTDSTPPDPPTAETYTIATRVTGLSVDGVNAKDFTYTVGDATTAVPFIVNSTISISLSDEVSAESPITFTAKVLDYCEITGWDKGAAAGDADSDDAGYTFYTKTYDSLSAVGDTLTIQIEELPPETPNPDATYFTLQKPTIKGIEDSLAEFLSVRAKYGDKDVSYRTVDLSIPVGTPKVVLTISDLPQYTSNVAVRLFMSEITVTATETDESGSITTATFEIDTSDTTIFKDGSGLPVTITVTVMPPVIVETFTLNVPTVADEEGLLDGAVQYEYKPEGATDAVMGDFGTEALTLPVGTPAVTLTLATTANATVVASVTDATGAAVNTEAQVVSSEDGRTHTYTIETSAFVKDAAYNIALTMTEKADPVDPEPPVDPDPEEPETPGIDGATTQEEAQAKVDAATTETGIALSGGATASADMLIETETGTSIKVSDTITVTVPAYYTVEVDTTEGSNGFTLTLNAGAVNIEAATVEVSAGVTEDKPAIEVTDDAFKVTLKPAYQKLWYRLKRSSSPKTDHADWSDEANWSDWVQGIDAPMQIEFEKNDAYPFYKVEATDIEPSGA